MTTWSHTAATVELELSIHSDETKRESKDNNQQHLDAETPLVIHVPKGAVISTINPNMVLILPRNNNRNTGPQKTFFGFSVGHQYPSKTSPNQGAFVL